MYRLPLIVIIAASLGACSVSGSDTATTRSLGSLDQMVEPAPQPLVRSVATSDQAAIAVLPAEAGNVRSVARQMRAESVQQTIEYSRSVPGQKVSQIRIALLTPQAGPSLDSSLDESALSRKPTEAAIRAELASEFPRMQMRVVTTPRSNEYGVYGLAVGQWANGARCIYAWQWTEPLKTGSANDEGLVASLRIRMCRNDMTLDQMASLVDRLKIIPSRRALDVQPNVAEAPARVKHVKKRVAQVADDPVVTPRSATPIATNVAAQIPASFVAVRAANASTETVSEPDPTLPAAAYRGPSAGVWTPASK